MIKNAIFFVASIVLLGCASTPETEKDRLGGDIRALECAIGYAAIDQMRRKSRLPDPHMVMGCKFGFDMPSVDISDTLDGSAAQTAAGAFMVARMQKRRFPTALITQISRSTAFLRIEKQVARLNAL